MLKVRLGTRRYFILIFLISSFSCIKSFIPNISITNQNFLVVEGLINSGIGPTQIQLSRTTVLQDSVKGIKPELGAKVFVEDSLGNAFYLTEADSGRYINPQLNLIYQIKYRLHIITNNNLEYVTDYKLPIHSPNLDSIIWKKEITGLQLNAFLHDLTSSNHYYHISYTETWKILSLAHSKYYYNEISDTVLPRPSSQIPQLYTCWNTVNSNSILLASNDGLSDPSRLNYSLFFIPNTSQKLSQEYSLLVSVYSMDLSGFNFYQSLKKATEPSNSLFNPFPSQIKGNIHSLTNPKEQTIGYIQISELSTKRIFISNEQVSPWLYRHDCPINFASYSSGHLPKTHQKNIDTFNAFDIIDSTQAGKSNFQIDTISCLDCRVYGSPIKPSFWPN